PPEAGVEELAREVGEDGRRLGAAGDVARGMEDPLVEAVAVGQAPGDERVQPPGVPRPEPAPPGQPRDGEAGPHGGDVVVALARPCEEGGEPARPARPP